MTLGKNIRQKRLEYDIEQQELAKRVGINKTLLCNIEKGRRRPSVDELLGRKAS